MRATWYILVLCLFASCKKSQESPVPVTDPATSLSTKSSSFTIDFHAMAGNQSLQFDKPYINAAGETFSANVFKYFIGNIVLHKPDGSNISLEDTYYIIQSPDNEQIKVQGVPLGSYNGISFDIGVDSVHQVQNPKSGTALDPLFSKDLFWDMGEKQYINLILNGTKQNGVFEYMIGGYKKGENTVHTINCPFTDKLMDVRQNAEPNIRFNVDVLEIFKSPQNISFVNISAVHNTGSNAVLISENYKDMFLFQFLED